MEEILKAVEDMKLAAWSGDPAVAVLMMYANASYLRSSRKGPSLFHASKCDMDRAEMKFEKLFKSILHHYSPSTQPR